jgi:hypothetical protein
MNAIPESNKSSTNIENQADTGLTRGNRQAKETGAAQQKIDPSYSTSFLPLARSPIGMCLHSPLVNSVDVGPDIRS